MKNLFIFALVVLTLTYGAGRVAAEERRPNVLIVVLDDVGFMDFSTYGGEADTPTIDALAARGVKLSRYYTSPQCGPSRAMLLTGADNHEVGMGSITETLTAEMQQNPGYSMRLPPETLTLGDRLSAAGYRTYAIGKWGIGDIGANLPNHHGFDHSFVFDATGADNFEDKSYIPLYKEIEWYEDGHRAARPADIYSSELFVDKAIDYIDSGDSSVPFFAYVAFQAVHLPIQAPRSFIDQYNGRFDSGWDVLRAARLERARALGLFPSAARVPTLPEGARDWNKLDAATRALMARMMQVNAGMLTAMDFHLGRLITYLFERGELENTIIIVVSDNGPESVALDGLNPLLDLWLHDSGYDTRIENLGERGSMAGIGKEWASVAAVPFSRYKFHATEGGQRVPMVIAGPGVLGTKQSASEFIPARAHVFDIVPTVLDLVDVSAVSRATDAVGIRGRSLLPVLRGEVSEVYGADEAVGIEVSGNASLYRGRWKLQRMPVPLGDGAWHLYDLAVDPGETRDLQDEHPALFSEMLTAYHRYESEVGVVATDADYNPFKQIGNKATKSLLLWLVAFSPPFLVTIFGVVGIGVLCWGVFRWRRGGRATIE